MHASLIARVYIHVCVCFWMEGFVDESLGCFWQSIADHSIQCTGVLARSSRKDMQDLAQYISENCKAANQVW